MPTAAPPTWMYFAPASRTRRASPTMRGKPTSAVNFAPTGRSTACTTAPTTSSTTSGCSAIRPPCENGGKTVPSALSTPVSHAGLQRAVEVHLDEVDAQLFAFPRRVDVGVGQAAAADQPADDGHAGGQLPLEGLDQPLLRAQHGLPRPRCSACPARERRSNRDPRPRREPPRVLALMVRSPQPPRAPGLSPGALSRMQLCGASPR